MLLINSLHAGIRDSFEEASPSAIDQYYFKVVKELHVPNNCINIVGVCDCTTPPLLKSFTKYLGKTLLSIQHLL